MEFKITGTGRLMKFRDDDKEVVIPSTVKSISAYAFSERYCLERIVIPEKYRKLLAEMAYYLAGYFPEGWESPITATIGKGEYPNVIKEQL